MPDLLIPENPSITVPIFAWPCSTGQNNTAVYGQNCHLVHEQGLELGQVGLLNAVPQSNKQMYE